MANKKSAEYFKSFSKIGVFNPKMTLFVQGDIKPNVPDLLNVEYLQQNRNFRVFNSEHNLFFFRLMV